jgi:hypothetical protein
MYSPTISTTNSPAPQQFGFHGQSHPLFVGEPMSLSSELLLEHTVLLDEIVDDHLLLAVKPAGQRNSRRWKGCMTGVIARTD